MMNTEKALNQPEPKKDSVIFTGENITYAQAMERIRKELKGDKDCFTAWHANIAAAFVDEYGKQHPDMVAEDKLYTVANKAAENFINNLCR